MATVEYAHISLGADGVPVISGTRTKVVEVIVEHLAYGWEAQEIHDEHPYMSLGQIHSALAYYYDHKTDLDADIQRRLQKVQRIKSDLDQIQGEPPLVRKLKQTGGAPLAFSIGQAIESLEMIAKLSDPPDVRNAIYYLPWR